MTTTLLTIPGLFKAPEPATASLNFDVRGKLDVDVCEFGSVAESAASVLLLRITDLNDTVLLCDSSLKYFEFRLVDNNHQALVLHLDAVELELVKGTYVVEVLFRYGLTPSVHRKYYLTYSGITLGS